MRIWPRSPRAIIARACSISWWPEYPLVTPTILFFAPDSASSSRACALVKHSGFSQTTCSPACSAAWQISKWVSLGVATDTARMPSGRPPSPSNGAGWRAWQRWALPRSRWPNWRPRSASMSKAPATSAKLPSRSAAERWIQTLWLLCPPPTRPHGMGWPSAISPLIMVHVLLEFVGFCFRHAPQWPAAGWPHGVPAGASGSVLAQVFVDVGGGHQLERHPQFRRHGLAPDELQGGIDRTPALPDGVLEHGHLQLAGLHRRQRVLRGIDAGDHDRVELARGFERLYRADRHLVVVGDHGIDRNAGGDPVGHQVCALDAAPVGRLLGHDLYGLAWRLGDHILDILRALDGRLVRQVADHHRHAALAAEQPADLAGLQGARVGLVGADEHHLGWQLALGRRMGHIHQRDGGGAGPLGHPRGRLGVYGDDDDGVDLLGNEVLDLVELARDVVLRVVQFQVQPFLAGRIGGHAATDQRQPGAGVGNGHGNALGLCRRREHRQAQTGTDGRHGEQAHSHNKSPESGAAAKAQPRRFWLRY